MQTLIPFASDLTTLFGVVVTLAVTVVGFWKGRSWLKAAMTEPGWTAEETALYEKQGREVDNHNNSRGMSPGWGAFHGEKGSGLHRGKRRS